MIKLTPPPKGYGMPIATAQSRGQMLLWIFALSGFAGLIYQSIWTQYLGLFLGHAAYAQSLVLMLFMGGMALGAWIVSLRSASIRRPLLAYAIIEAVIGVLGLTFDTLYQVGTGLAYEAMASSGNGAPLVKWSVATALVLPQCVLLGATFPLMSAGFMRLLPSNEGHILSGLYFSNSIGAAIGALASTYLLLPMVGLPGTILTAAMLNIAVALAVYPFGRSEGGAPPSPVTGASGGHAPLLVLAVAGLTGASSFVYEITWVRMLSLALGTTIHAFELMLAAFIAGIAFGGLWLRSRADKLVSPLATAGWIQVWMGVAALGSMFVYANAFEWVAWLLKLLTRTPEGYNLYNIASGIISMLVMFPAAFCAGMTLPLLTLALLRQGGGERVIGQVYAVNTLGAIIGVLAAVHLLMPLLGLKQALMWAAAVDLVLGVILLRVTQQDNREASPRHPAIIAAALSICAIGMSAWMIRFDPLILASSVYRHGTPLLQEAKMLYYRDGKTASIAVYEQADTRAIATNGKVDAGIAMDGKRKPNDDEYTMTLAAAIPLSMRDRMEKVGVIGFGSGMTTHSLLGSPRVGSVDTVEIEPIMIEGARLFGQRVHRAYEDPRSHIVIDDAKSYFSSASTRYDLIISEPSNPWMGGTAALFSQEFYAFVPRHLSPDGLFVQWLQLYEIDASLVSSVLGGLLANFNDVQAYLANGTDLLLVASPAGTVPGVGDRVFKDPDLSRDLARLGIGSMRDLQDSFLMDRAALAAYTQLHPARINSDFFPTLQLNAPVTRFTQSSVNLHGWHAAPWPVAALAGGFSQRRLDEPLTAIGRPLAIGQKEQTARDLRALLLSGEVADGLSAPSDRIDQALALRSMAEDCRLDAARIKAIVLVLTAASETIAFLDRASLSGLWNSPTWLPCAPESVPVADAFALVQAISQGDHAGTIAKARALLRNQDAAAVLNDPVASHYLAGSLLFAALASGRPDIARDFVERDWERLSPRVRSNEALQILLTMAQGSKRQATP